MKLIVGLGNPGSAYEKTRHNVGFRLLRAFAEAKGIRFKKVPRLEGMVAQGELAGVAFTLLMPLTFMNRSGLSVARARESLKVDLENLLLISDDVDLPFGKMRLRKGGSSGGHNGLKSVEYSLQTQEYPRLKIGVGDRMEGDLADYVLAPFSVEEELLLPKLICEAIKLLDSFVSSGIEAAMQLINKEK